MNLNEADDDSAPDFQANSDENVDLVKEVKRWSFLVHHSNCFTRLGAGTSRE